jgi:hypothetical protein
MRELFGETPERARETRAIPGEGRGASCGLWVVGLWELAEKKYGKAAEDCTHSKTLRDGATSGDA